jgi:hypothetical protein
MRFTFGGFRNTRITLALLLAGSSSLAGCSPRVSVESGFPPSAPVVEIAAPAAGTSLCGAVILSTAASSDTAGVQFMIDGTNVGPERTTVPFKYLLNTNNLANTAHTLTARARNASFSQTSAPVGVTVDNTAPYCSPKFIPTFLVYYHPGRPFQCGDEHALAQYDLIDTDPDRYDEITGTCNPGGSTTWALVKAVNPNLRIFLYKDGPHDTNWNDSTVPVDLNVIARYDNSLGHSMGSLNLSHPELFLTDEAGSVPPAQRIYNLDFSDPQPNTCASDPSTTNHCLYLMDFGSVAYQSYWLEAVRADDSPHPWLADGIFADDCLTLQRLANFSATPYKYDTDASWSDAMNSFATTITAGLHASSQLLWCNRGGGATRSAAGVSAWKSLDAGSSPPDLVADEGAFAVAYGNRDTLFYSEPEWRSQVDAMSAIANSRITLFSHTKLKPGQSGTDNFGQPVTYWQSLWYALGSFLLGKQDAPNDAYFYFSGDGATYASFWWHDEYIMIDLGKAVAPYTVSPIGGVNIYSREFQKGYVYVNPSDHTGGSVTVSLPPGCTCRERTHENLYTPSSQLPVVTSIRLSAHNAAIVLKTAAS